MLCHSTHVSQTKHSNLTFYLKRLEIRDSSASWVKIAQEKMSKATARSIYVVMEEIQACECR